jgi:hypothetical protein
LGPCWLDCDEPKFACEFPWGDTLRATDPVPEGAEYFRITGLGDGSGAEHEASAPIGYKAVLIGMNVAPRDNDSEDFLPPGLSLGLLGEWIEVMA